MTTFGGEAEAMVELNPERPKEELARLSLAQRAIRGATVRPEDIVDAFLAGRNPRTLQAYNGDLEDFARYLELATAREAVVALISGGFGAANAMALGYRVHLTERGLAASTVCRRLAALRSVVRLARQLGQVIWTLEVQSPKSETYRDTRGPGDAGWAAMAETARREAGGGSPVRQRDRAILRLAHDLALRVSEVVGLDLADVELEAAVPVGVWILGKGRAERERLTVPRQTAVALAAWLHLRGADDGPLFHRLDRAALGARTRLTTRAVQHLVRDLGRRAGLARSVRPHGLRHHAITRALDKTGGDMRTVQRFSRHRDPKTLMVYDDRRRDVAGDVSQMVAEDVE